MSKIKDLNTLDRPREKALQYGIDTLSNEELLAVIIGSGTKDNNVLDIGHNLINYFGGLSNLKNAHYLDLVKIKGISKITAIKLCAIFLLFERIKSKETETENHDNNLDFIVKKYSYIGDYTQEIVIIVVFNRLKRCVFEKMLFKGTSENVSISTREIFKEIFLHDGYSFCLIHNHPNNVLEFSIDDIQNIRNIAKQARKIGLKLIDSFIIAKQGYISFKTISKKKCD